MKSSTDFVPNGICKWYSSSSVTDIVLQLKQVTNDKNINIFPYSHWELCNLNFCKFFMCVNLSLTLLGDI